MITTAACLTALKAMEPDDNTCHSQTDKKTGMWEAMRSRGLRIQGKRP